MKLTNKEMEVIGHIKEDGDITNEELSKILGIEEKSVKFHITNIHKKLGATRRRDLVSIIGSTLFELRVPTIKLPRGKKRV